MKRRFTIKKRALVVILVSSQEYRDHILSNDLPNYPPTGTAVFYMFNKNEFRIINEELQQKL